MSDGSGAWLYAIRDNGDGTGTAVEWNSTTEEWDAVSPEDTRDLESTGGADFHGSAWLDENIYVGIPKDESTFVVSRTGYGAEDTTYDLELDSVTYTISVDTSGRVIDVTNDA